MRRALFLVAACSLLAACGAADRDAKRPTAKPHTATAKLPFGTGRDLLVLRDRLLNVRKCRTARRVASTLQQRAIAAVNAQRVPAALQEDLMSRVNAATERLCAEDVAIAPANGSLGKLGSWLITNTTGRLRDPQDLRISRSAVTEDVAYAVQIPIYDLLTETNEESLVAHATPGLRAVYALWEVDGEIENGGFDQMLWNSSGSLFDEAVSGARRVGAVRYADLLEEAAAAFPDRRVPPDREERQRELDAIPETRLTALDDRWYAEQERRPLDAYLERYIRAHPREFFRD